jgi:GYF domain 2
MTEWYYARGGQQSGPVGFEQLGELARNGGLDAAKDLVWTSTMADWVPAGQIPGIFDQTPAVLIPKVDRSSPYAPPMDLGKAPVATSDHALGEIIHGSEPIEVMACMKRGFELTKRNFGTLVLVGLTYFGIFLGVSILMGILSVAVEAAQSKGQGSGSSVGLSLVTNLVTQVLSVYLSLGLTRIGLNIVSGAPVSVGMLFSGGAKLLRAIGATIIFSALCIIGLIFFIVPGIYFALRYGQYLIAIVDRDMGIMEAFSYSSSLTTNNKVNIMLLRLLGVVAVIAGMLALLVGVFFAIPVIWLSMIVAYRWMQYGHRAAEDHDGTKTPVLSGIP